MDHLSDHDLERYHLGMIVDEAELAPFEEHLLACFFCVRRAEETADYVDAIRSGIILGDFDLDCEPPMLREDRGPRSARMQPTVADLLYQLALLRDGLRLGQSTIQKLKRHQKVVDPRIVLRKLAMIQPRLQRFWTS
jgi:hypothetical protein